MQKALLAVCVLFLINCYVFIPSTIAQKNTQPKFQSAFSENDVIQFQSFSPIDWQSLAPEWVKAVDIKNPKPDLIAKLKSMKNMFDNAEVKFEVPIEGNLPMGFYYLVSGKGITDLRPIKLIGSARFGMNPGGTRIRSLTFYGYVISLPEKKTNKELLEGGFVVFSAASMVSPVSTISESTSDKFLVKVEDKKVTYSFFQNGKSAMTLTQLAEHPAAIKKSYSFFADRYKYIFIQWMPDKECNYGCCEYNYALFEATDILKEVTRTSYGCDI